MLTLMILGQQLGMSRAVLEWMEKWNDALPFALPDTVDSFDCCSAAVVVSALEHCCSCFSFLASFVSSTGVKLGSIWVPVSLVNAGLKAGIWVPAGMWLLTVIGTDSTTCLGTIRVELFGLGFEIFRAELSCGSDDEIVFWIDILVFDCVGASTIFGPTTELSTEAFFGVDVGVDVGVDKPKLCRQFYWVSLLLGIVCQSLISVSNSLFRLRFIEKKCWK